MTFYTNSTEFASATFDIRSFIDRLTPAKGKNRYICPACDGNNLTIDEKNGAYQCWNGCECKDIRNAIAPLDGSKNSQFSRFFGPKKAPKYIPARIPEGEILLAIRSGEYLPPNQKTENDPKKGEVKITTYPYSPTQWIERRDWVDSSKPKGRDKKFSQWHLNSEEKAIANAGDAPWPPYHRSDITPENCSGKWIISVEGEKCANAIASLGLVATTLKGGAWGQNDIESMLLIAKQAGAIGHIFVKDNDKTGHKKAADIGKAAAKLGIPFIEIDPLSFGVDLPEKGDIFEVVEAMNQEEFIERLEREIHQAAQKTREDNEFLEDLLGEALSKSKKNPSPREIGLQIAEKYQPEWAYHNEQKVWRVWDGKCWKALDDDAFGQIVFNEIEAQNIEYKSDSYIENAIKTIKRKLLISEWKTLDRKRFIPFQNCILDIESGEISEHYPGARFTSCLPRDYSPLLNISADESPIELLEKYCPHTYQYMLSSMEGDQKRILKLIAIINGVLKWRFHDLEMFVYLVGQPGSGKSTFGRLLEKIVGKANHQGSSLGKLDDAYELARIIDSQLVICPDEDKKAGNFGALKRLTGGDNIAYRQIYKSPASSPFYGSLMLISNNNIFAGDTAGIKRRCCLVSFDNPLKADQRNSKIEDLMQSELSALSAIALKLPDDQVSEILKGLGETDIPLYRQKEWELTVSTNSVAAFIEESVIYDANSSMLVADLFAKYSDFAKEAGLSPMARNRFSQEFVAVATQYLSWEIDHAKGTAGKRIIRGVKLRTSLDAETPSPSDSLGVAAVAASGGTVAAHLKTPEPLQSKDLNTGVAAVAAVLENFQNLSLSNESEDDDPWGDILSSPGEEDAVQENKEKEISAATAATAATIPIQQGIQSPPSAATQPPSQPPLAQMKHLPAFKVNDVVKRKNDTVRFIVREITISGFMRIQGEDGREYTILDPSEFILA